MFISPSPGSQKLKIRVPTDLCLVRACFLASGCVLTGERGPEFSGGLS